MREGADAVAALHSRSVLAALISAGYQLGSAGLTFMMAMDARYGIRSTAAELAALAKPTIEHAKAEALYAASLAQAQAQAGAQEVARSSAGQAVVAQARALASKAMADPNIAGTVHASSQWAMSALDSAQRMVHERAAAQQSPASAPKAPSPTVDGRMLGRWRPGAGARAAGSGRLPVS